MKCDRLNCGEPAVAVIPRNEIHSQNQDINVCESHFRTADAACFYVVRKDEVEGAAHVRFMAKIKAKHRRVAGSDRLRIDSESGEWVPNVVIAI